MDYHLNRKVVFSEETEYSSLYKWSLYETDDADKMIGTKLIPWSWSLYFSADALELNESLSLKTKVFGVDSGKTEAEDDNHLHATLRPGRFYDPDRAETYSMFGTDRAVSSFDLWIYSLEDDTKEERCNAWGSLSYTAEIDFHDEVMNDCLSFYLHVRPTRFKEYVEMVKRNSASVLVLRLGAVHGFYSEWSPSISTGSIKVLTNLEDHKLMVPEGTKVAPPTVGEIGEFHLTFCTKRDLQKPARKIDLEDYDIPDERQETVISDTDESLLLQRAALKLSVQTGHTLKQLSYAGWGIVALLVLILWRT